MHEDARVNADNILVKACHSLPPISLDVVLKFYAHLTVIINGSQSIIDFA